MPLLIGSAHDESSIETLPATMTVADYVAAIDAFFGAIGQQVQAFYPPGADPVAAYVAATSDEITCKVRHFANAAATADGARPVHRYFLTHAVGNEGYGAYHGEDLDLLFPHWGQPSYVGGYDGSYVPTAGLAQPPGPQSLDAPARTPPTAGAAENVLPARAF